MTPLHAVEGLPDGCTGLDVVGDIHGQLAALQALGRALGYATDGSWNHPSGRQLVFLGDLVDRGPASLETAELVLDLCARGRAVCLMGNHEYNLVATVLGLDPARPSNRTTLDDLAARPQRWEPVLQGLATLPLALELPGLRAIHAEWHSHCVNRCRQALAPRPERLPPWPSQLMAAVLLASPFTDSGLLPDLPQERSDPGGDRPHELLIKGHEEHAPESFLDSDGHQRTLQRACWWQGRRKHVPRDRTIVFGHYWNLPPRADAPLFAPPYASGHPSNLSWIERHLPDLPRSGSLDVPDRERFVCVDYNGLLKHAATGCVGAYRWPEAEVVWTTAEPG